MHIGPIWRAMLRSKSSYLLIALQIAVTMAIIVNAIAIIQERNRLMARPSGVDEANLFHFTSNAFVADNNNQVLIREDLERLRNFPGVADAVATNSVPLHGGGWSMSLSLEPGEGHNGTGTAIYFVDEHGLTTFGSRLVAGRNFRPDEIDYQQHGDNAWPPLAIVSQALADALFPDGGEAALGKTVYIADDDPVTIVGIVETLQAPWSSWSGVERAMLVPQVRDDSYVRYVVRAEPGQRDALMPAIETMMANANRNRIIDNFRTMEETRASSYLGDSGLVKLLTFVATLLTLITGLGIVGLASFNVSRRIRQIGTRRALGATRGAIISYFMLENFLVTSVGIALGAILAVGLNLVLVQSFEQTRISWYLIPVAMVALWIVGQIAAAGPARRASLVPPAVATRAV